MHSVCVGCVGGQWALSEVGAVHPGSAAEAPEVFPQGVGLGWGGGAGLVCPSRVIKMKVCFNKDTLGHFFPTELARVLRLIDMSRKPDILLKKKTKTTSMACAECL